jgi:hypothetical protein
MMISCRSLLHRTLSSVKYLRARKMCLIFSRLEWSSCYREDYFETLQQKSQPNSEMKSLKGSLCTGMQPLNVFLFFLAMKSDKRQGCTPFHMEFFPAANKYFV